MNIASIAKMLRDRAGPMADSPTWKHQIHWRVVYICFTCVAVLGGSSRLAYSEEPSSGLIVVDNCDPLYQGRTTPYFDNLTFFSASGKIQKRISGLNMCEEIGNPHRIAVDGSRKNLWISEIVGRRLVQFDFAGNYVRSINDVKAHAVAIDPATGNLWVARSTGQIGSGATEVYDRTGVQLGTYDAQGYDIAYDGKSKSMWLVDNRLTKLSLDGKLLLKKDIAKWCAVSVAVDQKTGAVWIAKRAASTGNGTNELLCFDSDGKRLRSISLEKLVPFRVAINDRDGSVWVAMIDKAVHRYSGDGKIEAKFDIPAKSLDLERTTGNVWVATNEEVLKIDRNGTILSRTKHAAKTTQVWIASH